MLRLTPAAIRRAQRFGRIYALRMQGTALRDIADDVQLGTEHVGRLLRNGIRQKRRHPKTICPECKGLKEKRATTCQKCYHPPPAPCRERAERLYRQGIPGTTIAKACGVTSERVYQYLRPLGIVRSAASVSQDRHRHRWKRTQAARKLLRRGRRLYRQFLLKVAAARLYLTGLSMSHVSQRLGLRHHSDVQRLLPRSVVRPTGIRPGSRRIGGHWISPEGVAHTATEAK